MSQQENRVTAVIKQEFQKMRVHINHPSFQFVYAFSAENQFF